MAKKKTTKKKVSSDSGDSITITCKEGKKDKSKDCCKNWKGTPCSPGVYCLGFVGAAVYYLSTATGFWNGVWGVIKALFWPAFLVFELLKFLGM